MKNNILIDELFEAFDQSFKDDKEDQRIMLRVYSESGRYEDETYATVANIKGFIEFHLPKIISKVIGQMEEVIIVSSDPSKSIDPHIRNLLRKKILQRLGIEV